jgi:hypothetical protein
VGVSNIKYQYQSEQAPRATLHQRQRQATGAVLRRARVQAALHRLGRAVLRPKMAQRPTPNEKEVVDAGEKKAVDAAL